MSVQKIVNGRGMIVYLFLLTLPLWSCAVEQKEEKIVDNLSREDLIHAIEEINPHVEGKLEEASDEELRRLYQNLLEFEKKREELEKMHPKKLDEPIIYDPKKITEPPAPPIYEKPVPVKPPIEKE